MVWIHIDQAKEGMVLEKELADQRGHVLLRAGEQVLASHLAKLRRWGIHRLCVAAEPEEGIALEPSSEEAVPPALRHMSPGEAERVMQHRFRAVQGDEFLEEVRQILVRLLSSKSREGS